MQSLRDYIAHNRSLAWPLAVNAILVQSMLMIDTLLVAPLGELPVAAMGIATTIITFVLGVEIAIGNGIQLLVGKAYGSGRQDDLTIAYWVGLLISVLTALAFFIVLALFSSELVRLITDDSALIEATFSYLSIAKYLVLVAAYTQTCTAFYNGISHSKVPFKGFLLEIPVNILLSYCLINGVFYFSGLGLIGAAYGSLIAIFVRAFFFTLSLKLTAPSLRYPQGRPIYREIKPQFEVIFPVAANFVILSLGATAYQLIFAQLSVYSFAAITLIFPWLRAGTQFTNAWAQASAITISQALGKGHFASVKNFISAATQIGMGLSLMIACGFVLLAQYLDLIYPDVAPQTRQALQLIAPLYLLLPVVRAYNALAGNMLRALGQSAQVLQVHFFTQWLFSLPLCAFAILALKVSVFWAFAFLLLEEIGKIVPFYFYKKRSLEKLYNPDVESVF